VPGSLPALFLSQSFSKAGLALSRANLHLADAESPRTMGFHASRSTSSTSPDRARPFALQDPGSSAAKILGKAPVLEASFTRAQGALKPRDGVPRFPQVRAPAQAVGSGARKLAGRAAGVPAACMPGLAGLLCLAGEKESEQLRMRCAGARVKYAFMSMHSFLFAMSLSSLPACLHLLISFAR
jgi:hypothetical protein